MSGLLQWSRDCMTTAPNDTARRRRQGRPRSARAHLAILDAAYALVLERGYANVTTAEIAAHAGAGKQTLYRWWPTKGAVVLAALVHKLQLLRRGRTPTTLPAFLAELCRGATAARPVLRALIAEAQHDAGLRAQLGETLLEPYRVAMRGGLPHLRPQEREWVIGAIYGAVMYRLLLDEPLDAAFARGVVRMLGRWHG